MSQRTFIIESEDELKSLNKMLGSRAIPVTFKCTYPCGNGFFSVTDKCVLTIHLGGAEDDSSMLDSLQKHWRMCSQNGRTFYVQIKLGDAAKHRYSQKKRMWLPGISDVKGATLVLTNRGTKNSNSGKGPRQILGCKSFVSKIRHISFGKQKLTVKPNNAVVKDVD